jgi:hypothetical protein
VEKMYYNKCLEYIKNAKNPDTLYNDIRTILKEADEKTTVLKDYYPSDYQIKTIQRAADAKYIELTKEV